MINGYQIFVINKHEYQTCENGKIHGYHTYVINEINNIF